MVLKLEILMFGVVLASVCLLGSGYEYGVSSYSPPPQTYTPPQPYYEKPIYYDTYDTQVDYREANMSRKCGILPAVHRNEYGYEKDRLAFGEFPWLVAVLDNYQVYLAAGSIITPRHILTSAKALAGKSDSDLVVRIGEYDLQSDHNYLEAYKNYEIAVIKVHYYYSVPKAYGYGSPAQPYNDQYNYDVAILELYEDIEFDTYPQAEPVCLAEHYQRAKTYYTEKTYSYGSYGYGGQAQAQEVPSNEQPQIKTQIGLNADLECWTAGWRESPLEKISYEQQKEQQQQSGNNYGYSYKPTTYYDYYEQSRTPRKAKVNKVYEYESYAAPAYGSKPNYDNYGNVGYEKPYKTENWQAEYYYDACHADAGSPIFCLVPAKYAQEYEKNYSPPAYQPEYQPAYQQPAYQPEYQPSYQPNYQPRYKRAIPTESYQPKPAPQPGYPAPKPYQSPAPQSYQPQPSYPTPPSYKPAPQPQPAYQPQPSYQPQSPPAYPSQQTYQTPPPAYQPQPSYQAPPPYQPVYQPPAYKFPTIQSEQHVVHNRRAVVVGVVSYSTECTYTPYTETKKITVTPVKDILDWILSVIFSKSY